MGYPEKVLWPMHFGVGGEGQNSRASSLGWRISPLSSFPSLALHPLICVWALVLLDNWRLQRG